MIAYIAMLRGINVGGQKKIRMQDLQALVAGLGHSDVRTYIQSGNVVFRSVSADPAGVAAGIEEAIERNLGFEVGVLLRSREELARVIERNPFLVPDVDTASLHVTFLAGAPEPEVTAALTVPDGGPDEYRILDREVYLHCPQGYGRSKLNNTFWERKLRVPATTRNWNTVVTLLQLTNG